MTKYLCLLPMKMILYQHLVVDQMDIKEIVEFIDLNCYEATSTPWSYELIFSSSINGEQCKKQNILKYIDSKDHKQTKKMLICFKVYRNPTKYPSCGGYNSATFQNVFKDLSNASITSGFNIVKNGSCMWKSNNLKMVRFVF